jgi:hypothetical protein
VLHRRVLRARHALDAVRIGGVRASTVSRARARRSRARRAVRGVFVARKVRFADSTRARLGRRAPRRARDDRGGATRRAAHVRGTRDAL